MNHHKRRHNHPYIPPSKPFKAPLPRKDVLQQMAQENLKNRKNQTVKTKVYEIETQLLWTRCIFMLGVVGMQGINNVQKGNDNPFPSFVNKALFIFVALVPFLQASLKKRMRNKIKRNYAQHLENIHDPTKKVQQHVVYLKVRRNTLDFWLDCFCTAFLLGKVFSDVQSFRGTNFFMAMKDLSEGMKKVNKYLTKVTVMVKRIAAEADPIKINDLQLKYNSNQKNLLISLIKISLLCCISSIEIFHQFNHRQEGKLLQSKELISLINILFSALYISLKFRDKRKLELFRHATDSARDYIHHIKFSGNLQDFVLSWMRLICSIFSKAVKLSGYMQLARCLCDVKEILEYLTEAVRITNKRRLAAALATDFGLQAPNTISSSKLKIS